MHRALGIVLCFGMFATACGGDKEPKNKAGAAAEAKKAAEEKKAKPITSATWHAEWQRCAAYFNAHDEAKLAECFPKGSELVFAGEEPLAGPDGVIAFAKSTWAAFPQFSMDTQASWVSGKTAAILLIAGGVQTATNKTAKQLVMYIADLDDDWKIKRLTVYSDQTLAAKQLGSDPPPVRDEAFEFRGHIASTGDAVENEAVELAAKYTTAFNNKDVDGLTAMFADDATAYHPSMPAIAKGKPAIKAAFDGFFAQISNAKQQTVRTISAGGWVVVEQTWTGRIQGLDLSAPAVVLFKVDNGLITGSWNFENTKPSLDKIAAAAKP